MEDTLREMMDKGIILAISVLILVLMEDTLRGKTSVVKRLISLLS